MASPSPPARLQNPIILIHGLGAKSCYGPVEYFYGLPKRLRQAGNQVMVADLSAWHTLETRQKQLREQLDQAFPDSSVRFNLIGHSMGGIDARFLAAQPGFRDQVASVVTVGTPNRGTVLADLALGLVPSRGIAMLDRVLALIDCEMGGFKQMASQHHTEELAARLPDSPGVAYFSATTAIARPVFRKALPIFWLPHRILEELEGPNDGFVSVKSSIWGEHICTLEGDHYAQIGQLLGRCRGLDYHGFWNRILGRLHQEGF